MEALSYTNAKMMVSACTARAPMAGTKMDNVWGQDGMTGSYGLPETRPKDRKPQRTYVKHGRKKGQQAFRDLIPTKSHTGS
jgi:hypothetical protein